MKKTLKYIYAHPDLTIDDYRTVSPYLGLDYQTVLFILRVFFELKFVSFTDNIVADSYFLKLYLIQFDYVVYLITPLLQNYHDSL